MEHAGEERSVVEGVLDFRVSLAHPPFACALRALTPPPCAALDAMKVCVWSTGRWGRQQSHFVQDQPDGRLPCVGPISAQFHNVQLHKLPVVCKSQLIVYEAPNVVCLYQGTISMPLQQKSQMPHIHASASLCISRMWLPHMYSLNDCHNTYLPGIEMVLQKKCYS